MQAFRDAMESRDPEKVARLLTEDIEFRSPAVYKPYRGRDEVMALLKEVAAVLEDFRFVRQIGAPDAADHALVFNARVGDREVEGADFIHLAEDGRIEELYVMFRPLSGLMAMAEAMQRRLAAQ